MRCNVDQRSQDEPRGRRSDPRAASVMAAQGRDLGSVALVMVAFAFGTALPLLLVDGLS